MILRKVNREEKTRNSNRVQYGDVPFVLRYEQETIQLNTIKRTAVSITEITVFFIPKFKMKDQL